MRTMAILDTLQKQIKDLESRIAEDQGKAEDLRSALSRLKMQEFEEDIRESDNRQLLKG
jgi:TolA-binding protein